MLRIPGIKSDRKLRLFLCACLRRVWNLLPGQAGRNLVEAAEWFADGKVGPEQLAEIGPNVIGAVPKQLFFFPLSEEEWFGSTRFAVLPLIGADLDIEAVATSLNRICTAIKQYPYRWDSWVGWGKEPKAQAALVREIFGNPFRPVTADPSWLASNNGTVPKLAQAIYEERAFDRLPILGDALEDAGCTNQDMLMHCRSGGEHVRGCWVVDLLLAKG
jgi:hypothetical protein